MRKRRCPRRNVFVSFVTTAFVRRRNTLPRSFLIFLFFTISLAEFLFDAEEDVDGIGDVVVVVVDLRPLSPDFKLSPIAFVFALVFVVGVAAINDDRVRRTTAFAVSMPRLFLKAIVPTELIVVLLVDTTLKPRELLFAFCFSNIFLRFSTFGGNSFLFLLIGFGVKSGKIWRTARFAGKLASIR